MGFVKTKDYRISGEDVFPEKRTISCKIQKPDISNLVRIGLSYCGTTGVSISGTENITPPNRRYARINVEMTL